MLSRHRAIKTCLSLGNRLIRRILRHTSKHYWAYAQPTSVLCRAEITRPAASSAVATPCAVAVFEVASFVCFLFLVSYLVWAGRSRASGSYFVYCTEPVLLCVKIVSQIALRSIRDVTNHLRFLFRWHCWAVWCAVLGRSYAARKTNEQVSSAALRISQEGNHSAAR